MAVEAMAVRLLGWLLGLRQLLLLGRDAGEFARGLLWLESEVKEGVEKDARRTHRGRNFVQ